MSIDDNHQNLSLIQQALEAHFDVISSTGEESVEELVADCEPQIILLDIMLTDKSGYDICRDLRKSGLVDNTFIIFVSSLASLSDKLKAYEAGGDDYICKPLDLAELEYKLEAYKKRFNENRDLRNFAKKASQVACASMQYSTELSILSDFFKRILTIDNLDSLYENIQDTLDKLQLKGVVELRAGRQIYQYPRNKINRLESEILELGKRAKAIVPFGANLLFNSKQCSILIKQIPEDEYDVNRLKEQLSIMVELISGRVDFIENESLQMLLRHQALINLKGGIAKSYKQLSYDYARLEHHLHDIFDKLQASISHQMQAVGANAQLQANISDTLTQARHRLDNVIATNMDFSDKMKAIDELIENIK